MTTTQTELLQRGFEFCQTLNLHLYE